MSYQITVTKRHMDVAEGTKAEAVSNHGKKMYRFSSDSDKFDTISFSWDYIQNHKEYFDVSRSTE